jgi:hypothetical protein
VNEFVEKCRREWKRLGVPTTMADEMAAELAADLEDARAEGVSPADILGQGASDPRAFASAWAAERPVGDSRRLGGHRALLLGLLAALAALAIAGAVLVTVAGSTTSATKLNLTSPTPRRTAIEQTSSPAVWITQRTGDVITIEVPRPAVVQNMRGSDDDTRTLGLVLLIVGVAGIVPLAAFALSRRYRVVTRSP